MIDCLIDCFFGGLLTISDISFVVSSFGTLAVGSLVVFVFYCSSVFGISSSVGAIFGRLACM